MPHNVKEKKVVLELSKYTLDNDGDIMPLVIDPKKNKTRGTGLTNGSINVINDKLYVNIRHVEYTLFHSEKCKYAHPWGPVVYLHPENDWTLRTNNYLGVINKEFNDFEFYSKVDTSAHDKKPLWEFVGLEDARIVHQDDKLFLTGVRRDTTDNGVGRMELSEIEEAEGIFKEISRQRIPIPGETEIDKGPSYCEKNWMPVVDMPYYYVKWCNPVEVVKYDPETKLSKTVYHGGDKTLDIDFDFRGGSQVIPYKNDYRIALCHVTNLWKTETDRKDCTYRHRFIIFDKEWNVVKFTDEFNFMGFNVEFSCGMVNYKENYYIPFGTSDNTSFLLKIKEETFDNFIEELT